MKKGIKIILWQTSENSKKTFSDISLNVYNIFMIFNILSDEYRPNYIKVKSFEEFKNVKKFNWDYNNFYNVLLNNINNENSDDFGYSLSFFSSKKDNESVSYSIRVGAKLDWTLNTIIIKFPNNFDINKEKNHKKIETIFIQLVETFHPYWGAVINQNLEQSNYGYPVVTENRITGVHWLNYFSPRLFENINYEHLININNKFSNATFKNNILKIQNLPINEDNINDLNYLKEVEDYLLDL